MMNLEIGSQFMALMRNKKGQTHNIILVLLFWAVLFLVACDGSNAKDTNAGKHHGAGKFTPLNTLKEAFNKRQRDLQVLQQGEIIKILPDDTKGSKHQRFIVKLGSGQTLLIAHNIDLAPRVPGLQAGDVIVFSGEYEWNEEGGVVHWTHHDPDRRHGDGWLEYKGITYQ